MKLNNPRILKKGDKIGIVSPSAGLANYFPHRVEQGKKILKDLGFESVLASHSLEAKGYVSASPQERAQDLNDMFSDSSIRAIMCTIGGNHSNQILKYLNFDLIRANPKVFVGYSDITVLHYAFTEKSQLRTFYGPCLMPEFGEYPEILPYTLDYFMKALTRPDPIGAVPASLQWTDEFLDWLEKKDMERPRALYPSSGYEWWREGQAEGEIFGGAIPSINHLAGSEYWIEISGKILFIDIPEGDTPGGSFSMSWLDSFLADFDNLGVFKDIRGLIIGRPYSYKESESQILKEMINYYTDGSDYPILYNANIGHASPIITLPLGVKVVLNSRKNLFEITESGVAL